jgi:hypothetical protein
MKIVRDKSPASLKRVHSNSKDGTAQIICNSRPTSRPNSRKKSMEERDEIPRKRDTEEFTITITEKGMLL